MVRPFVLNFLLPTLTQVPTGSHDRHRKPRAQHLLLTTIHLSLTCITYIIKCFQVGHFSFRFFFSNLKLDAFNRNCSRISSMLFREIFLVEENIFYVLVRIKIKVIGLGQVIGPFFLQPCPTIQGGTERGDQRFIYDLLLERFFSYIF